VLEDYHCSCIGWIQIAFGILSVEMTHSVLVIKMRSVTVFEQMPFGKGVICT
jgi:hypothetical protein